MGNGYSGKYVIIDLSAQKYEKREFDADTLKNFVGGPALGAKVLYDEMPAKTPWDAPESMIGFVAGPTNGTGPLLGARYTVVSKSPATNMWNDANSGGHFGPILRKTGYDAVFVKGISAKPVYVLIDNGDITFHDATHLWGKRIEETEHAIKKELDDDKVGIALIGPAGERKSLMAAVMNDTHRAAGRGGSGAVMGSKNFKALVCRGDFKVEPYDKSAVVAVNKEVTDWAKNGPLADNMIPLFFHQGTGGTYEGAVISGDSSVKNWGGVPSDLTEEEIHAVGSESMDKRWKTKKYICNTCSLGCGAIYEIKDGKYPIKETGRPEYETMAMFGSGLKSGDAEMVNWCNYLCNDYGYDTISFGAAVAWAMECFENGLFTRDEVGGIDLNWGNSEAIVKLSESICNADTEIGKVLNLGVDAAAKHYGRGTEYAMTAGGIEVPQHDPRRSPGLARTYQYDPTPGRHVKGGQGFIAASHLPPEVKYNFDDPGQVARDLEGVVEVELMNNIGFCEFSNVAIPPGTKQKMLTALTGTDYTGDFGRQTGLRSYTMRHAFNLREGMVRETNKIAGRVVGKPAMTAGPNEGVTIDNEKLADAFFTAMDWDLKTLTPSKAALENLGGLEPVIADLYG
ncbi:MAG: hypothetical protein FWC75_02875 [Oscillospiraceae bacterium]|nr:hypothetical protein [Oscillospiraceae bacterium]